MLQQGSFDLQQPGIGKASCGQRVSLEREAGASAKDAAWIQRLDQNANAFLSRQPKRHLTVQHDIQELRFVSLALNQFTGPVFHDLRGSLDGIVLLSVEITENRVREYLSGSSPKGALNLPSRSRSVFAANGRGASPVLV